MAGRIMHTTLFIIASFAGLCAAGDWPQLGRTPQHTSYVAEGPKMPFRMMWRRGFAEKIAYAVQPVIAQGKVYLGTKSGSLFEVDGTNGDSKRIFKADAGILATAAHHNDLVYCTSLDGFVYAFNAEKGTVEWKRDTGFGISTAPLVAEGKVFIVNRKGKAAAFNAENGKLLWETELGAPCLGSPAYDKGKVFVGTEDMFFHALDAKDGGKVWRSERLYGTSFLDGHPVVHSGRIVVNTLFREVCGSAHECQPYKTAFGPWWWSDKDEKATALIEQIEEHKGFPESLIVEQDKIVEYYKQNPEYMSTFVLDAETGQQPYIVPNFRDGGNGLNPMPAMTSDGYLIMQFHLHGTAIGKFDIERGRFVDIFIKGVKFGNNDEPHAFAVAGDIVFALHQEIAHQQASSFFNLSERKQYNDKWASEASKLKDVPVYGWSPYQLRYRGYSAIGSLLKHGTSVSISGNRFYFIRENWLDAFEGDQGGEK